MSPFPALGPKDEAGQDLGKEWSDVIQAALQKGPGRFQKAMAEGIEAIMKSTAFIALMKNETDATDVATFDTKKVVAQIGVGIMRDNAKDFFSLD